MSLPAPPSFKHARGGASPFRAAADTTSLSSSDMWAIDRSDNHHYYPSTTTNINNNNHNHNTPSSTSRRLGNVDNSWAGSSIRGGGGGADQFDVPMPPMPTDFPPPPPKGLVKSIVTNLEQPTNNKRGGTNGSTTPSKRGTVPVSTKQQQRSTTTKRVSNQSGGLESWDYSESGGGRNNGGDNNNNVDAADYQDLLVKYKKYVDDRIMPRLTKALESLSTTESKLEAVTAQLADVNEEKQSLKGSVQQLRSLLDQERVISSRDQNERLQLIKQSMEAERAELESRLKVAERAAQSQSTSSGRVAELERTLELRDMEIRTLKQQQQQLASEASEGVIGVRPSTHINNGGGGDGLNEAESMDRVVAEMEVLISESISFGRAFEESSSNAGLDADYSPSVVWNTVSVAAGLEDDHVAHFDSSRMCNSIAAIRKAMKSERAAVSTSLGQLAASHAELLESIGNREHEMWRVKDMHQQRLEDLERDFNEQLQNLNAQLQYQTQYGASSGGGGGGGHGFGGGQSHSSPSGGGGGNGRGSNVTFTDLSPLTVGASSPQHNEDYSDDNNNGNGSQPRNNGRRQVVTANTASQTNLELSLLFPGTGGGGSIGTPVSSPADFSSSRSKGMPTPNGANGGDGVLDTDLLGLIGSGGGPQAVQSMNRLVAELKLLQDENVRLKDEVRRLRDERQKYLGFMRMGSEGASSSMAGFGTSNHRIDIGNTRIQKSSLLGGSTTGLLLS